MRYSTSTRPEGAPEAAQMLHRRRCIRYECRKLENMIWIPVQAYLPIVAITGRPYQASAADRCIFCITGRRLFGNSMLVP